MDEILVIGVMALRLLRKHTLITEGTNIFKYAHNDDKKCVKREKNACKSDYVKSRVLELSIYTDDL